MQIVIVGGVAAGASCATRARRLMEDAQITIIERGPYVSFANCGLPYYLGGEIASRDALLVQTPAGLKRQFNIDTSVNTLVTAIDPGNQRIQIQEQTASEPRWLPYDELVLATGAAPIVPPIPGLQGAGVFTVRTVPDVDAILAWQQSHQARSAAVIGAGFIGLEMAEQLSRRGLDIHVIEALDQVMAPLDPEMAALLHRELTANGIHVHLGNAVTALTRSTPADASSNMPSPHPKLSVALKNGQQIPVDMVILAIGVRPETALAQAAGLEIGVTGGIKVDKHLRTSAPHVWAAGDAVEVQHQITGKPTLLALAGPANRQGRTIANNIAGMASEFSGVIGTWGLRLFGLTAAAVGCNERTLKLNDIAFQSLALHPASHASYYPGAERIAIKVLFNPKSGRILGAQAVGRDGVDKRIDVIATTIRLGGTVHDLADLELCYAPPLGSAKDPVNHAGMASANVVDGLVTLVDWREIQRIVREGDDSVFLLDVRNAPEIKRGTIPGAHWIPLPELRQRLAELPHDKTIVVHCQSGQRSYFAARLLTQKGFTTKSFTGSYLTWQAIAEP